MYLFAHVGITVATGIMAGRASTSGDVEGAVCAGLPLPGSSLAPGTLSWTEATSFIIRPFSFANHYDYRLIAVGSVLPDLDKFIGLQVFGRFDRSIFHTLLWLMLLVAVAVTLLRRTRDTRGLQLTYCWALHLVLDAMWTNPQLLLWPFLGSLPVGSEFGIPEFQSYAGHALRTNWHQYVPELIGLVIVLSVATRVTKSGRIMEFLRTGRLRGAGVGDACSRQAASIGQ